MKLVKNKTGMINILGKIHYKTVSNIYKNMGFLRTTLNFDLNIRVLMLTQYTGHEIKKDWPRRN